MHILIAEDDGFLRSVYSTELTNVGYEVTCVENGDEALATLTGGTHIDLVLLDALMPKKDGFQVLEEKKKNPAIATIPVIMLTSLEQEKDMQRAATLGVANYFVKTNINIDGLVALVTGILPAKDTTSGLQQYRGAFIADARQCMEKARAALQALATNPADPQALFEIMRLFHSVKSSSALMGYGDLSARCYGVEKRFKDIIDAKGTATNEDRTVAADTALRIEETIAGMK